MSGGGIFKSITSPVSKILSPLKKVAGDITGTTAAKAQANAIKAQTQAQQAQYQTELQQEQSQNQLDSQGDVSNVATVTAGGTASAADSTLSEATRKNRKQLITSTLGL